MNSNKGQLSWFRIVLLLGGSMLICLGILSAIRYERTMLIVKEIERKGGNVEFVHYGPRWLVKLLGNLNPCRSVEIVELGMKTTDDDLSVIGPLKQTRTLFLNGTEIEGAGLTNLMDWSRLQDIDLTKSRITDKGMLCLIVLPQITALSLVNTKITDEGAAVLEKLNGLQELNLQGTRVTDQSLHYFIHLPLKDLNLKETPVTTNGIFYLKANIPGLSITY